MSKIESWSKVVSRPGLEASKAGRLRFKVGFGKWVYPESFVDSSGYLVVRLPDGTMERAHRLVLEAFVGPCPLGCWGVHINDKPADNRIENLAWGTPRQNSFQAISNGKAPIGSRKHNAKLTEADVLEIRRLRGEGVHQRVIAERFDVSRTRISYIDRGLNWSHVACYSAPKRARPMGRKLSESDVIQILKLRSEGKSLSVIGSAFGVSKQTVARIAKGKSWKGIVA